MSHIHIPDGILPLWLWLSAYLVVFLYVILFKYFTSTKLKNKKIALIATFSAIMLIAMSILVIPPLYHLKLAALSGIILGPFYSVIAIFVVNLLLAFAGHGGITVVGLNTIVVSIEAILAYAGFKFLKNILKNTFIRAFLATLVSLIITLIVTTGIMYAGTRDLSSIVEHNHSDCVSEECMHEHSHEHSDEHSYDHSHEEPGHNEDFDLKKFILYVFTVGSIGLLLESFITAFIVNYLCKVKPDLFTNENL